MIRDQTSFTELTQKLSRGKLEKRTPYFERMVREQVQAEKLTGSQEWDLFLSYVQGLIERTEKAKVSIDVQLSEAPVFNTEKLLELKVQSMLAGERLFTLHQVLGIPKVIVEEGTKGMESLSRLQEGKAV